MGVVGGVGREIRTAAVKETASSISPTHTWPRAVCLCCQATYATAPWVNVSSKQDNPLSPSLCLRRTPGTAELLHSPRCRTRPQQKPPVPLPSCSCSPSSDHALTDALDGSTRSTLETKPSGLLPPGATDHILGKGSTKFWRARGKKLKRYG